jgi:ribosomal protein S18 acetylase RimI-like enzyme
MQFRAATEADVEGVAALHADSWQRHYRGIYPDAFLDHEVVDDRHRTWAVRLTTPLPNRHTVVAEHDGVIVGFVCTFLDDDPKWGALVDNLHVTYGLKRHGIGTLLMAESARTVVEHTPGRGLFLWVLEENTPAQAFYQARGGTCVERAAEEGPGGGSIIGLRYAWPDPSVLLTRSR